MAILRAWKAWQLIGARAADAGGSLTEPIDITVDGLIEHKVIQLANNTTVVLWDSAESIATFDYFYIKSDQDIRIEWTCDRGAEVGTVVFADLIESNTPWDRFYDDALASYTANFATGTVDVIDRIRVRNISGSTANIEYVLIT